VEDNLAAFSRRWRFVRPAMTIDSMEMDYEFNRKKANAIKSWINGSPQQQPHNHNPNDDEKRVVIQLMPTHEKRENARSVMAAAFWWTRRLPIHMIFVRDDEARLIGFSRWRTPLLVQPCTSGVPYVMDGTRW
jgi:hypothetical protein